MLISTINIEVVHMSNGIIFGNFIESENISTAWLNAVCTLRNNKNEAFGLAVKILNPTKIDQQLTNELDNLITKSGLQSLHTVSNTIFPQHLYRKSENYNEFFRRFNKIYLKIRKSPKNRSGTYFGRLTNWNNSNQDNDVINQINKLLNKINYRPFGLKSSYLANVFDPLRDQDKYYGFPCLSFIDFKLEPSTNQLHLIAFYRNHRFWERAYGNYVGLGQLLEFMCTETNMELGNLLVISSHAEIENHKKDIDYLINKYQS